jgi:prepilin-type N-terminal cleavage/methylation domain-containing protein
MQSAPHNPIRRPAGRAFTLVELLVVIAIISILMTAGVIGLGGISGGKGVSSAVTTAEAVFDEARSIAFANRTRARVLVSRDLINNPEENLRKIVVIFEKTDNNGDKEWELSSRGLTLPEQVFFSQDFSRAPHDGGGAIDEMQSPPELKGAFDGTYFYYEFNAEGICTTPGASFVVGAGVRQNPTAKPKVTSAAKRDFGGFVIWRNGSTSLFRSPAQIDNAIMNLQSNDTF